MRITVISPAILFLLLLLHHTTTTTTAAAPLPGLDTFLSQQYHLDPLATNDTLTLLPSHLKRSISTTTTTTISTLISSLLSLSLPISVHIKLVGPTFTSSSVSTLSSFLSASLSSSPFHVITPFHHNNHHILSLHHSLHHDASFSSPSLTSSLSSAIKSSLSSSTSSLRSSLTSIPYAVVDGLISADFKSSQNLHDGYTIYLINLGPQSKPYAYTYSSNPSSETSSPSFTKCLGSIFQGTERYLWVDLSAGPVDYGPGLSGDGVLPRGEFHPLAAFHGRPKAERAVLSDLASLVYSAYQVLLVPSLRIPVPFENSLVVQFIHVYEGERNDHSYGLDWGLIENALSVDGLLFKDQTLSFKKYEIKFQECALCSFAVSKAISSYTSRFLFDNYTLIVSEYVDSKKLHRILSDSSEEFKRLAGVHEDDDFKRFLPVYVFDLDYNLMLLLDRFHQSVAFKDMVIAIRTRSTQTVSDYTCNGRHVFTQTRELERPLIGSILQSMWGVSPTHLIWSPQHNSTLVDYTWSVGQTPFGPFSETSSLSFVQKDAARRNVLLTSLNYTISSAIEVLESVKAHGGYQRLLKGHQINEFSQRWFLFKYKLDKMISALSHLEFEMASYYLRSSDHDLYAMHSIIYRASQDLEASLVCFKDPPVPWASVSMSVATFIILCYVYAKRDKFFSNKRKQF